VHSPFDEEAHTLSASGGGGDGDAHVGHRKEGVQKSNLIRGQGCGGPQDLHSSEHAIKDAHTHSHRSEKHLERNKDTKGIKPYSDSPEEEFAPSISERDMVSHGSPSKRFHESINPSDFQTGEDRKDSSERVDNKSQQNSDCASESVHESDYSSDRKDATDSCLDGNVVC
jgi:hypothetical protein